LGVEKKSPVFGKIIMRNIYEDLSKDLIESSLLITKIFIKKMQVYLVTRRGTWILHRNLDHSVPFDMALNTRWHHTLSSFAPKELSAWYFQRM
jgi:hypothetical protein